MLVEAHSGLSNSLSRVSSSISRFAPVSQEVIQCVHYGLSASFPHRVYPGVESPKKLLLLTPKLLQVSPQSFLPFFSFLRHSRQVSGQVLICPSFSYFSLLLIAFLLRFNSSADVLSQFELLFLVHSFLLTSVHFASMESLVMMSPFSCQAV